MSWRARAKSLAFRALTWGPVNRLLIQPLRRIDRLRSSGPVRRLPVVGTVTLQGVTDRPIRLESDGRDSIASRIFWAGVDGYEPESLTAFKNLAQPATAILDVGANCGVYALIAATANADATVVAFEPVPEVFAQLSRNADVNGLANLSVHQLAVGDHDGDVSFFVPDVLYLPTRGSTSPELGRGGREVRVPCTTVDSYRRQHGCPRTDLIKIDAEGAEPDVLRGASETIADCRPVVMCEILDEETGRATQDVMTVHSYEYYAMRPGGLQRIPAIIGGDDFKNLLLVPTERADDVRSAVGVPVI